MFKFIFLAALILPHINATTSKCVSFFEKQESKTEVYKQPEPVVSQPRLDGDLNSLQTGTFNFQTQSFTYTLNYSGTTSSAYSIYSSSSYGVEITIYYLDSGTSHPFIVANNTIDFIPVSSVRTAYVLVQPLVARRTYSFSIGATQITNPSINYNYLVYEPSTYSLSAASYYATTSSLTIQSSLPISYSSADLDSPTADGVRRVTATGYPYTAIARTTATLYHSNTVWISYGSAFRIQTKVFGTAAHCLFDRGNWAFSTNLCFYTNQHGTNYDEALAISKYVLPISYVLNDTVESQDYGFAIAGDDTSTNYLGLDATETIAISDSVWTLGYPGFAYANNHMYWAQGSVTSIDQNDKTFNADYIYAGGGSGSAVIKNGKVVGIHTAGIYVGGNHVGSGINSLSNNLQSTLLSVLINVV